MWKEGECKTVLSEAEIDGSVKHESNNLDQPDQENIKTGN